MPKATIDYSKSFIYKLCCKDVNIKEEYIGSTTNMRTRKQCHKRSCHNEKDFSYLQYKYQFIRENGGFDNWDMVLVENYNATDNLDLRKRERYWTEELKASLNSINPYITIEERKVYNTQNSKNWRENNPEKYKENYTNSNQEWYINNKEYKSQYNKEYRENNKNYFILKMQEWKSNNKEHVKEYKKKYRDKRINCYCGSNISINDKSSHFKSKKHINFICKNKKRLVIVDEFSKI
jgi:hypothetical protein